MHLRNYIVGFFVLAALCFAAPSAYAACANPVGAAGDIIYNGDDHVLQYCDAADNWIKAGPQKYIPAVANYDLALSTQLTGPAPLSGVSDSKQMTGSFWIKFNQDKGFRVLEMASAYPIITSSANGMRLFANNAGASSILRLDGNIPIKNGQWHHVLFSVDLSNAAKRHYYIDEVENFTAATYVDDFMDFTSTSLNIGGAGAFTLDAQLADMWFETGLYMDFSVVANRRKFIDANGNPVYLGADGSIPTGSAPDVFLSGDIASWQTNKGTGGGFTLAGALNAGNFYAGGSDFTDGLAGFWRFDEITGSGTAADSSVNTNTGTLTNMDSSTDWVAGRIYHGLDFDGTDERVDAGSDASIDDIFDGGGTIMAWVYPRTTGTSDLGRILAKTANNGVPQGYSLYFGGAPDQLVFQQRFSGGIGQWHGPVLPFNTWSHVAITYDTDRASNVPLMYINGVSQFPPTNLIPSGTRTSDAAVNFNIGNVPSENRGFDGIIDDVRAYSEPLSGDEIAAIYSRKSFCAAPNGSAGTIMYNGDENHMQYCNGVDWISMGPDGDGDGLTEPTANLIAHWKLDERANTAISDSVGAANGTFTNGKISPAYGMQGTSIYFDGVDDVISAGSSIDISNSSFTVSAWAKRGSSGTHDFIFSTGDGSGATDKILHIGLRNDNRFTCAFYGDDLDTVATYTDDNWHLWACTYDAATNLRSIYRDGAFVISDTTVGDMSGQGTTRIGDFPQGGGGCGTGCQFDGLIDDVRLYNTNLSAGQVLTLYEMGIGKCTAPAGKSGDMIFNGDEDYLQYCEGDTWIKVGK